MDQEVALRVAAETVAIPVVESDYHAPSQRGHGVLHELDLAHIPREGEVEWVRTRITARPDHGRNGVLVMLERVDSEGCARAHDSILRTLRELVQIVRDTLISNILGRTEKGNIVPVAVVAIVEAL